MALGSDHGLLADEQLPPHQQEIRARCRHPHPAGVWEPFDWQAGAVSVPGRLAAVAARHPDRVAVLERDHLTRQDGDRPDLGSPTT